MEFVFKNFANLTEQNIYISTKLRNDRIGYCFEEIRKSPRANKRARVTINIHAGHLL